MTTETLLETRYPECDRMGIVHHAVYPVWYEIARMDFFKAMGFSYTDMAAVNVNPAMVDLHIRYAAPATYPERLRIRTRIRSFAPKKLELEYEILRADTGEQVSSAVTFHIWVGPDMRSYDLERNMPEVYEKIRLAAAGGQEADRELA